MPLREGLGGYAVKIRRVHGIVAAVEGHRRNLYVHIEKLCVLSSQTERVLYVGLRAGGGVYPQIVYTVLVSAAIKYLPCIDGNGLTNTG